MFLNTKNSGIINRYKSQNVNIEKMLLFSIYSRFEVIVVILAIGHNVNANIKTKTLSACNNNSNTMLALVTSLLIVI